MGKGGKFSFSYTEDLDGTASKKRTCVSHKSKDLDHDPIIHRALQDHEEHLKEMRGTAGVKSDVKKVLKAKKAEEGREITERGVPRRREQHSDKDRQP